jgi:hypothetical protein
MPAPRRADQTEAERLQVLYDYDVLDSEPELSFDRLTGLAARMLGAPIALVTLVDRDRQWFKSTCGLGLRETSNSVSFCKHTLWGDDLLVVPDATADPRFADNPLVTGPPHIRFYAGAPLISPQGYNLGSLCVIDTVPRDPLDAGQRRSLQDLADMAVDELELRRVHRHTETGLRAHAERVMQAIQLSQDAVSILDEADRFTFVNRAHAALYGYTVEEMKGAPLTRIYDAEAAARFEAQVRPLLERTGGWHGTSTARHRDGSAIEQEVSLARLPGGGMVRVARDVTARNTAQRARRRLQAELHQAQKLEAVGRLAGGVAHDFNNILAAIEGYAGFLADDLPEGSQEAGYARQILTASERGKTLVQQILAFSRRDPLSMTPTDICEVVSESVGLLRAALPRGLEIDCRLPEALIEVRGNQSALGRAVMNLATNARDAMADAGGRHIEVSVLRRPGTLDSRGAPRGEPAEVQGLGSVRLIDLPDGRTELRVGTLDHGGPTVEVAVADTGPGIDPATLAKVLEPFYTTKPVGSGTGLGLSAVAGTALSHGGGLTIETGTGLGTRVVLHLPELVRSDARPADPRTQPAPPRPAVLVVDDDPAVAEMIADALTRLGWQALTAAAPNRALEILAERGGEIACVVTDLVMPQMSGLDLAAEVKAVQPAATVVLVSGRAALGETADLAAVDHVLEKPIRRDALAAALAVQDGRPTPAGTAR